MIYCTDDTCVAFQVSKASTSKSEDANDAAIKNYIANLLTDEYRKRGKTLSRPDLARLVEAEFQRTKQLINTGHAQGQTDASAPTARGQAAVAAPIFPSTSNLSHFNIDWNKVQSAVKTVTSQGSTSSNTVTASTSNSTSTTSLAALKGKNYDSLTIPELSYLLEKFASLPADEKNKLLDYMKTIEKTNQDRVNQLKHHCQMKKAGKL